jgi:predicted GNAT family acetyltransferase
VRVKQRVTSGRTYVLEHQGELVFKIDVGCRSQYGAELEGVYTLPSFRGKGHATLCLGQISRFLLSSLPRLTIRVDDSTYLGDIARKVGYVAGRDQRLVWL